MKQGENTTPQLSPEQLTTFNKNVAIKDPLAEQFHSGDEDQAKQFVEEGVNGKERVSDLQQIADDPGSSGTNMVGNFNKAVVSTAASIPKTIAIMAKPIDDFFGTGEKGKKTEDYATYKAGQWLEDKALEWGITATDPDRDQGFWQGAVPNALGSVAAIVLTGGAGEGGEIGVGATALTGKQAVIKGLKETGKALTSAPGMTGSTAMAVPEFEAARRAGMDENEALKVFAKNYFVGATEILPIQNALTRINKLSGGKLSETLVAGLKGGAEEAIQETVQQTITNHIAQGSYDPKRDLFQDVLKSAGAGFFVGFVLPGIGKAMQNMTPDQKAETRSILNETLKTVKSETSKPKSSVESTVKSATKTLEKEVVQTQASEKPVQDVKTKPAPAEPITPETVHAVADQAGIDSESQEFMDKSKELTGEAHLDNMTPVELNKVVEAIQEAPAKKAKTKKAKKNTVKDKNIIPEKDAQIASGKASESPVTDNSNEEQAKGREEGLLAPEPQVTPAETQVLTDNPAGVQTKQDVLNSKLDSLVSSGDISRDGKKITILTEKGGSEAKAAYDEFKKQAVAEITVGDKVSARWLDMNVKGKVVSTNGKVTKIRSADGTIYPADTVDVTKIDDDTIKATPKDSGKIVAYNSRRKNPIGIVSNSLMGENSFMMQTDLGKKIKNFFQKQFTAKGFLPKNVFDRWIKTKGEISKYESQIKFTIGDIKSAIKSEYEGKLTDAQITDLNLALQGKKTSEPIPPKTMALIEDMRSQIDNLTKRFIDEGVVAGEMSAKFTKNMGTYITRSYRKFDDPFWAEFVPDEVKNKAMAFLRGQYPNHSDEEMEGLINYLLYSPEAPMAILKGSKLGSKDLSILKKRGDIAPEIRALLGEYGDPLLNYARSITKMANLVTKHHFMEDVKADGMGKYLFEKPTGKYSVPIAGEGTKTMAPLNGLFTSQEIAEAFAEFNAQESIPNWLKYYMKINAYVKSGKTVFSVMTHARNFFGNIGFVVANGHWRVDKFGKAIQTAFANIHSNDKATREKFQEYIQLGIVQDSAAGGQLREYLEDIRGGKDFFETLNEKRLSKVKNGVLNTTQNLYQFEDDLYKIFAFENEYARYKKAYPDMDDQQLKEKCAEIVRNTYPTYSLVPKIVKSLRLNPFVGTFVSFPAEVVRTTYNTAALAKEELSNPSTRSIGAQRMAGLMASLLLPSAASMFSRYALGMDGEDDDDLRKFVAPWQKTSEFIYLNRTDDKYSLIDLGYSDPHSYIKRPIYALFGSDDITESAIESAKEILDPFLSEEMLTARLIDVRRNKKENGDHVYNPDAPPGDRAVAIYNHLAGVAEPGTVRSMENIVKAYQKKTDKYGKQYNLSEEVAALFTGQKKETKDISQALLFKAYEIRDRIEVTDKDLYRVTKSLSTTDEEKATAQTIHDAAMKNIVKDALEIYRAAIRLGADPRFAQKTLRRTGSKAIRRAVRGKDED
jgi:hypothetical protein